MRNTYKKQTDISNEFHVYRYGNGVKLARPNAVQDFQRSYTFYDTGHTVASLLNLPVCVHFSDTQSANLKLNENTVIASGFNSMKDAIGKTLATVFTRESANQIVENDHEIMTANRIKIFEGIYNRNDEINFQALSVKTPWYNSEDKIIGVFGCTIAFGKQSLAESLSHIAALGLLSPFNTTHDLNHHLPISKINNYYFSKRETECLHYYVQGKTSKEIAVILQLSKRTVENYLQNIKDKIGVSTKSELIHQAYHYFN